MTGFRSSGRANAPLLARISCAALSGIWSVLTGCNGIASEVAEKPLAAHFVAVSIPAEPEPARLDIKPDTLVTWTNDDDEDHSITSVTGLWDSGRIRPGESFSRHFIEPGTYPYVSVFQPDRLGGEIRVEEEEH